MLARLRQFHFALDTIRRVTADIDSQAAAALADANIAHALSTLQCAAVVSLSGFFESFLRGTAEDCIASINALGQPYAWLPEDLRKTNFKNAASIFHRRIAKRVGWVSATPEDLVRRIGKTVADPPDPTAALLWEAFAEVSSNPSAEVVVGMLGKFGIEQPWTHLSALSTLTKQSIETELTSFLAVRNQAAHSGLSNVVPSPSVIRDYCDLLEKVSRGFHEVIRTRFTAPPFNLALPPPAPPLAAAPSPLPIFGASAALAIVPNAPPAPNVAAVSPIAVPSSPGTPLDPHAETLSREPGDTGQSISRFGAHIRSWLGRRIGR